MRSCRFNPRLFAWFQWVALGLTAVGSGCSGCIQDELCAGVVCSEDGNPESEPHGYCSAAGYRARCICDEGFHEGANFTCIPDPRCGNGVTESPDEECDDRNLDPDDGCDNDCQFTCHADDDCEDDNPCTLERCLDNEYEDENGQWEGRVCVQSDRNCDDGREWTTDSCDEDTGECTHTPDEGFCTNDSHCAVDNDCIMRWQCDLELGHCLYWEELAGTPCESDGVFCNGEEECNDEGACVSPGDPCAEGEFCVEEDGRGGCYLEDECCLPEACYYGGVVNPWNPCESCQPEVSRDAWTPLPEGLSCDDEQWCNGEAACDSEGHCVNSGNPCRETETCNEDTDHCDAGFCGDGICSPGEDVSTCNSDCPCGGTGDCPEAITCMRLVSCTDGLCIYGPVVEGTPCDDGSYCNGSETCVGRAGVAVCFSPGNPCAPLYCDEDTDLCALHPPRCGDLNCDPGEDVITCLEDCGCRSSGECSSASACLDPFCWDHVCHSLPRAEGTSCNDGSFCNGSDTCGALGNCTHTGNPCAVGEVCNEETDRCES